MSAASIVSDRTYHPSIDQTPIPAVESTTTVSPEHVALAATLIRRKARSDADALILMNALGIGEVEA